MALVNKLRVNPKLEAIINYDAVWALESMLTDIEHGFFTAKCIKENAENRNDVLEAETIRSQAHDMEYQFNCLFAGLVIQYYDWFSKHWNAWTLDFLEYQESLYTDADYKRSFQNCDRMVLESLKDFLWVSVPQKLYLNNTDSPTFLEDAAKVLASKKESEEDSDI